MKVARTRPIRVGLAVLAAAGAMTLFSSSAAASAPKVTHVKGAPHGAVRVSMKDFAYLPGSITIHAGQTVTWTYDESGADIQPNCESTLFRLPIPVSCPGHSVTAVDTANGKPLFDSGVHRAPGFPYSLAFLAPGTYHYYCIVHGGPHPNNPLTHMDGTIVVLPAAPKR